MSTDARQNGPQDPKRALSPWTIAAALGAGAAAWLVVEIIQRVL